MAVSVVLYFSRSAEMIHKLTVSKSVDLSLRGFFRDGKNEFSGILYSRLVIMTTHLIEIASASCVYVMNHVMPAFLVRPKLSCLRKKNWEGRGTRTSAVSNTVHHVIVRWREYFKRNHNIL